MVDLSPQFAHADARNVRSLSVEDLVLPEDSHWPNHQQKLRIYRHSIGSRCRLPFTIGILTLITLIRRRQRELRAPRLGWPLLPPPQAWVTSNNNPFKDTSCLPNPLSSVLLAHQVPYWNCTTPLSRTLLNECLYNRIVYIKL